ncbi:hypothetical protein acdb102_43750 [Acidothermaceae bacterium B102]|nr:hypothetical protein acdb102_43750 [Acidothermaceae bacterium B102]
MTSSAAPASALAGVHALLEVSTGGGRQRGLGRYDRAVAAALASLGATVTERSASGRGGPRLAEFLALPPRQARVLHRDFDIFHATTPYASPVWAPRPVVVSIHDIIPIDVEAYRKTGAKASLFYRLAARADAVLTLSDHTAQRVAERLNVDPGRIVVAPLPVAPAFVADELDPAPLPEQLVGKRYVAALLDRNSADPRKRGGWLVGLAERLAPLGVPVVVTGAGVDRLPSVLGLGRVEDRVWATVLRHAELFAYTSAYEGQGLPPLEAISCGTPVVAFANTSIGEVVGPAGVLLDEPASVAHPAVGPHKPDDAGAVLLAEACIALLEDADELSRLGGLCAAQAGAFTDERFAAGVAAAYQKAL